MPWKVEVYPPNWDELARECKERANWQCEQCGVADGTELIGKKRGKVYQVRLAAAHVHHDPANPEPSLMALCQSCHLKYDRFLHGRNARRTRYRRLRDAMVGAGQLLLFPAETSDVLALEEGLLTAPTLDEREGKRRGFA